MKNKTNSFGRIVLKVSLVAFIYSCFGLSAFAVEKLKPEEIVAKHLESIGAQETRGSIKTRIISGEAKFRFLREISVIVSGRAVLASDGIKHLFGMQFDNPDYPLDRFGFDGSKATIAFIKPGNRSPLGLFVKDFDDILKYGLLGGSLSSAWPLADIEARNIKISGGGTKKIEGKECYSIELSPKGGSDLSIKLYFDAQTFQHVRTAYERVISAQMGNSGNPNLSASQREQRFTLYEDFSDYRKESGLMLPHSYKIYYANDSRQTGTNEYEWTFTLNQFSFNQKIDPKSFNVES